MISDYDKELIAYEVIHTLYSQFNKFPENEINNRNAPFHEAFLNAFSVKLEGKVESIPIFISLASWMHGLNTSLGQSFFEKTANILCDGEKKGFIAEKETGLKISPNQKTAINNIITDLTNRVRIPNSTNEVNECNFDDEVNLNAEDFTVDVFYENEQQIICIELKTVQPNNSVFRAEKHKLLESKIAMMNKYPDKIVKYYLGFPFDPLGETPTEYNKQRFLDNSINFRKYFAEDEILLSTELWNFLSNETKTMESILQIINSIATPDFLDKYNYLNEKSNLISDEQNYLNLLHNWFLYREKELCSRSEQLLKIISNDKRKIRSYNQNIFSNDGKYNEKRINKLISLIS